MSNGIESFLVVYGPKGKKIDIINNFNKFRVSVQGSRIFSCIYMVRYCDKFYKVGKAKFWAVWLVKVKAGGTTLSNIFKKFSNCPINIEVNEFDTLISFIYEAYDLTKQAPFKTRRTDHLMPSVNLRMLVPSPSGILKNEHVSRLATFGSSVKLTPTYLTHSNGVGNHSQTVHSFHTGKTRLSHVTLNL